MKTSLVLLLAVTTVSAGPDLLGDPHPERRTATVANLVAAGADSLPALRTALEDDAWLTRATACIALGRIGASAADTLLPAFADRDEFVRYHAARAGSHVGDDAGVRDALTGALSDPSPLVRQAAAGSLGGFGEAVVEPLTQVLSDSDSLVRAVAARSLGEIGEAAAPAAEKLILLLERERGDDYRPMVEAKEALTRIGTSAIPALTKALAIRGSWRSLYAAHILGELGPEGIPPLIESVRKHRPRCGSEMEVLLKLGPKAKAVVPVLAPWLTHRRQWERWSTADAISKIDPTYPGLLPILLEQLRLGKHEHLLSRALEAIARVGPLARDALPELRKLLADAKTSERLHDAIRRAIRAIEPTEPTTRDPKPKPRERPAPPKDTLGRTRDRLGALLKAVSCPDAELRRKAALHLSLLKERPDLVLPVLMDALREPPFAGPMTGLGGEAFGGKTLREKAVAAIARYGEAGRAWILDHVNVSEPWVVSGLAAALYALGDRESAGRLLAELLRRPIEPQLFSEVAYVAAEIGEDARPAVPGLLEWLDCELPFSRSAALDALVRVAPDRPEVLAAAVRFIDDENDLVRSEAWRSLVAMGHHAAPALPRIVEGLSKEEWRGLKVLEAMGPAAAPAVPAIEKLLPGCGRRAVETLEAIGRGAVPALVRVLDIHPKLHYYLIHSLGRIGPDASVAVPALMQLLSGQHRWHVVTALGLIGPNARAAYGALSGVSRRSRGFRTDLMDEALARIRGEL